MRIVYNSFAGRCSDSPRVLHDALVAQGTGDEHVWLADPAHATGFPPGVETVELGSPASIEALEAADLVVANTHTEVEWDKRPGAIYLQTWHGTPLKRIHWDVLWAPEGRLERLSRDVARWDVLVSPNRWSTPRLRGAFRFDGTVLETGYPRNDVLSAPDRDAIRARIRAELGIADRTRAILYAPTWRDDVVFSGDGGDVALPLDLDAFDRDLGGDHCLLLRAHYMLTGRLAATAQPSVRDVSLHPDISELYLAADVLVTDYSSTMFDFAVTGRPILFLTPDLVEFGESVRGFYFDLAPEAPGPLLDTTDELVAALRDLPATVAAHAERYARFRERFCHLEDGHATARLLEGVLPAGGGSRAQGPTLPHGSSRFVD